MSDPQTASTALQSVGRVPRAVLEPFSRPAHSSELLNQLETEWWNENGELIERVWSLPDDVCQLLREPLAQQARDYFKTLGRACNVIELGCGSGWFGRMLASRECHVIGMDISQTQIDIARNHAREQGLDALVSYEHSDQLERIAREKPIDGVLMHAFLHHLYWDELHKLFQLLDKYLPDGCKFMIIEPVYPEKGAVPDAQTQATITGVLSAIQSDLQDIRETAKKKGWFDDELQSRLDNVVERSQKCGFFLSPKETVFAQAELRNFLSEYVSLTTERTAGFFAVDAAQTLGFIKDPKVRRDLGRELVPKLQTLDLQLHDAGLMDSVCNGRYFFNSFFGTARKCGLSKLVAQKKNFRKIFDRVRDTILKHVPAEAQDSSAAAFSDPDICEYLFDTIISKQPTVIVETGSFMGLSTLVCASALQEVARQTGTSGKIYTISLDCFYRVYHPMSIAAHSARDLGLSEYICFLEGSSIPLLSMDSGSNTIVAAERLAYSERLLAESRENLLPRLMSLLGRVDLAYLDSLHNEGVQMIEIAAVLEHLSEKGQIVIDDVYFPDRTPAWIVDAFLKTDLTRTIVLHKQDGTPLRGMTLTRNNEYASRYGKLTSWWWPETLEAFVERFRLKPYDQP